MILRSSLTLLGACRSTSGSVFGLALKKNTFPRINQIHWKTAHRSAFRPRRPEQKSIASDLKIPFLFTVGTGTACYFGNHYLGKLISPQSYNKNSVFSWWHSKPDSFKVYWLICGTCISVFSVFRICMFLTQFPSLVAFMNRYFVNSANSGALVSCVQLITSAFTHIAPLHLGINMYILHNICETVPEIGKDKFLGCYLFSTVSSGFASLCHMTLRGLSAGSVGASGAIFGLLGLLMYKHPEYSFYIIFLPFLPIPTPVLFTSVATLDFIGVIRGWSYFDHAGHLGGLFSGVAWELLTESQVQEAKEITFKRPTLPPDSSKW